MMVNIQNSLAQFWWAMPTLRLIANSYQHRSQTCDTC